MTTLRIEFFQIHQPAADDRLPEAPAQSAALTVTGTPTSGGSQVVVPSADVGNLALLSVSDAPVYVSIAASPDPTTDPRHLVMPGSPPIEVQVEAGHKVSAVLASDVTLPGIGAAALSSSQVVLSTTATLVKAANPLRVFAEVKDIDAAINVYLGKDATVTAANGHLLKAGEAFGFEHYVGAIWAIAASGTPTVTAIEW